MKTMKSYRFEETTLLLVEQLKKDLSFDETKVVEHAIFSLAVKMYDYEKVERIMLSK